VRSHDLSTRKLTLTKYCSFVADYIADHATYKHLIEAKEPAELRQRLIAFEVSDDD
jgi:hypothetical protein